VHRVPAVVNAEVQFGGQLKRKDADDHQSLRTERRRCWTGPAQQMSGRRAGGGWEGPDGDTRLLFFLSLAGLALAAVALFVYVSLQ
jgi:hypothetical protein